MLLQQLIVYGNLLYLIISILQICPSDPRVGY